MGDMTARVCRALVAVAAVTLLAGILPRVASAQVTDDNVTQQLQNAKTPADHQALADYFKAKASAAAENATKHEAMMGTGSGRHGSQSVWRQHCLKLIK